MQERDKVKRKGREKGRKPTGTLGEDILKGLAHAGRMEGEWEAEGIVPGEDPGRIREAMAELERKGKIEGSGKGWRLTATGRARAVELLRAHRLLETYLAREEGRPTGELHAEADRAEHYLSTRRINELADSMNRPRFDPHGDPIPERAHDLQVMEQRHLPEVEEGAKLRIAHVEDEPEEDFRKLMDKGISVELPLRVKEQRAGATVVELAGRELVLPEKLARLIEVTEWPEGEPYPEDLVRLRDLGLGEEGEIAFLSPACMGPERRRLLDFGLVPGSSIRCEFKSPFGSPVAYLVRGSTIGLRREQTRNIYIRKRK
ncbi:MAG: FeoA domain-containing protein [Oceanipulchritudo sp.]